MKHLLLASLLALTFIAAAQAAGNPDLDRDGTITSADLALLKADLGRTDCARNQCDGDLNDDGKVDLKDLGLFRQAKLTDGQNTK